ATHANGVGLFFPEDNQEADAGLFLGFSQVGALNGRVYGPGTVLASGAATTNPYKQVSQGSVTGTGTALDPWTLVTVYDVRHPQNNGQLMTVTQTITYVEGDTHFSVTYDVHNVSPSAISYRASAAADLFISGDDKGTGFLLDGTSRYLAGANVAQGES